MPVNPSRPAVCCGLPSTARAIGGFTWFCVLRTPARLTVGALIQVPIAYISSLRSFIGSRIDTLRALNSFGRLVFNVHVTSSKSTPFGVPKLKDDRNSDLFLTYTNEENAATFRHSSRQRRTRRRYLCSNAKYRRRASRTSSDRVRRSTFRTCSSSSIISGGTDTENVAVVLLITQRFSPMHSGQYRSEMLPNWQTATLLSQTRAIALSPTEYYGAES